MHTRARGEHTGVARFALTSAAAVAAGLVGGSLALAAHFARRVLTPATGAESGVTVAALEPAPGAPAGQRVWLHGPDAGLSGKYSFIWNDGGGHARLGPVTERVTVGAQRWVAREVVAVDRGELRIGVRGRITGWWYTDPESCDSDIEIETERVSIAVDGGHIWAWLVTPKSAQRESAQREPAQEQPNRWAIHVHGRGALPEETLRGVLPAARAGLTSLVIAYRNDPGAPRGLRGRYGLGLAERRDVDDAISWACARGAERVTLLGWSMGGTISVLAANRGPYRSLVDGLVLDSPALDWPSVLHTHARATRLPRMITGLAMAMLQRGWVRGAIPGERGTDLRSLTAESLAQSLRVPVLIHASPDDTYVPWWGARRFAQLRPELVSLREAAGEHVKLWNTDPDAWETATEAFIRALRSPAEAAWQRSDGRAT